MKKIICWLWILALSPCTVFASQTGNNPWESILTTLMTSITGPVTYTIAVMCVFGCGLAMAFADLQGGAKRFVQVAIGLSIAIMAVKIVTSFLGFSGAVI